MESSASRSSAPPTKLEPLLAVENLRARFPIRQGVLQRVRGWVEAVNDVSFELRAGRTLGLVGESGCGKTTVGRTILQLIPPAGGDVRFEGQSILDRPRREMQRLRRSIQMIFQDPLGSLNPRMRVGDILAEPLIVHGIASGAKLRDRVEDLVLRCGLWRGAIDRYPHEFSGGQRQRIAIARALSVRPKLIVCDEPTSALDVSIQAQILNLLLDLQEEFRLAYLFISHDMAVIHHMCDRVAVMKDGRIVEIGGRDSVTRDPRHPYTQTLLGAVPEIDPRAVPTG